MADWNDQVKQLLFEGETVQDTVELDDANVYVTSHRILAFTPELEGANFHKIERPNVTGVTKKTDSDTKFLGYSLRAGITGGILMVMGFLIDFESIIGLESVDTSGAGKARIGGLMSMINSMMRLLGQLDEYMRMIGALLLLFAIVPFAVYVYSRNRYIAIEVAGDDSVAVAPASAGKEYVERVRTAIIDEPNPENPD